MFATHLAIRYRRCVSSIEVRRYGVDARSTDTYGRVLWSCREQHFVADGPVQNGCPGEAVTPAELFLAGVATCGVELLQVIARANDVPLESVDVQISARWTPRAVRSDVNVFNSVRLAFELTGPDAGAGRGAGRELQAQVTALRQRRSCDAGRAGEGSRHRLTGEAHRLGGFRGDDDAEAHMIATVPERDELVQHGAHRPRTDPLASDDVAALLARAGSRRRAARRGRRARRRHRPAHRPLAQGQVPRPRARLGVAHLVERRERRDLGGLVRAAA